MRQMKTVAQTNILLLNSSYYGRFEQITNKYKLF
jgi:hypothetical protein